ncbi:3-dehydroquinate synthase [Luteitalea sp.]|uniref:3-dehydroquinate synthase n=1 Tax=Luteitalea sp. TaxID=2004800 RepID=UPI000AF94A0D|nr:3-dehydroquinate synthase [Luteitalea sp.]
MSPHVLEVHTRSAQVSRILIAPGLLSSLDAIVAEACPGASRLVVVSSPQVWGLHGAAVRHGLGVADREEFAPVLVPDGEKAKTMATLGRIHDALVVRGIDRKAVLVVVGGGVIGDMAGFAAASYLRGIRLVHVPTTVVAQTDSAIGGKVGVNHRLGKNLLGAFHQPALVAVDPTVLTTLSRRELRAGLYEVVKYGVIASPSLFTRCAETMDALLDGSPSALLPVITDCCAIKADVVTKDEREDGLRRILNFGHTIGHALEAVTNYRLLRHGEAVAYGMKAASAIAVARGTWSATEHAELVRLLDHMGPLPAIGGLDVDAILAATRRDKKVVAGTLHFVLPTRIGDTTIATDVDEPQVRVGLAEIGLA